jgi:hypothetical protein
METSYADELAEAARNRIAAVAERDGCEYARLQRRVEETTEAEKRLQRFGGSGITEMRAEAVRLAPVKLRSVQQALSRELMMMQDQLGSMSLSHGKHAPAGTREALDSRIRTLQEAQVKLSKLIFVLDFEPQMTAIIEPLNLLYDVNSPPAHDVRQPR